MGLGKATTAMRDVGRSIDRTGEVKRAEESLAVIQQSLADHEAEEQQAVAPSTPNTRRSAKHSRSAHAATQERHHLDSLGLIWMPYRRDDMGSLTKAWEQRHTRPIGIRSRRPNTTKRKVQHVARVQGVH